MGRGRHDTARPKLLLAAVLGLVLSGLLILTFACTDLTSDADSTTSTSTTLAEGVTTGTTDTAGSGTFKKIDGVAC